MKTGKKILSMALASALCVGALAGCGGSSSSEPTNDAGSGSAASTASSGALTVNDGVLTMGTNAAFPPYEYYDGDTIIGIDADIAQALADKLGLKLEIIDMDFGTIVTSVQSGKVDVGIAGMTDTPEREENVSFTDSYATGVQVIIVPDGSAIKTVDDLDGALIGVQESTTAHIYCSDDYGEDNVIAYTNGATAVQALLQGKIDCVVIDEQPAKTYVSENEGLTILDTEYVTEEYAIAVNKENTELLDKLNAALDELQEDGTVQEILDKYITAE